MIEPKNNLERAVLAQPEVINGLSWDSREGPIGNRVEKTLARIPNLFLNAKLQERLRLVIILCNTFKHKVDPHRPKTGTNHHAVIARRFAQNFIYDQSVLDVIEYHDKHFNLWRASQKNYLNQGEIDRLATTLDLPLYLNYLQVANEKNYGEDLAVEWFIKELAKTAVKKCNGRRRKPQETKMACQLPHVWYCWDAYNTYGLEFTVRYITELPDYQLNGLVEQIDNQDCRCGEDPGDQCLICRDWDPVVRYLQAVAIAEQELRTTT